MKVRFERKFCCSASICKVTRCLVELERDEAELSLSAGCPSRGFGQPAQGRHFKFIQTRWLFLSFES
jgi:hypothetical protein